MHRTPQDIDALIAATVANAERYYTPPGLRDDATDHPAEHEYQSERLGARELGVGRFNDGGL